MKLELHILQNFAPSNLNRDDTGAPKDCEFGGVRRARISSQCLKRAVRAAFSTHGLIPAADMAARTKRLVEQVVLRLTAANGRPEQQAAQLAKTLIEGGGFKIDDEARTEYLLFLPRRHIEGLADLIQKNWDILAALTPNESEAPAPSDNAADKSKPRRTKRQEKADTKAAFPRDLGKEVAKVLADGERSPDLALFGRMIADHPDWNVDAACQVAHAISTNRVGMEFDFYTAVDDFRGENTHASDMMGTIAFNSACFYRYSVLDLTGLEKNLNVTEKGDLRKTVEGFLRAAVLAIPTGKQNSMAAQNLPSYVLAVVRPVGAPLSLANAFLKPVRPNGDQDLVDVSIARLEGYLQRMSGMYGASGVTAVACADRVTAAPSPEIAISRQATMDGLVAATLAAAMPS